MSEYVLGTDTREFERLRHQHAVWAGVTNGLLDRLELEGARCLDLGCGPGFVTEGLRGRVGDTGHVLAVDADGAWATALAERAAGEGWTNVEARAARAEELELAPGSLDFVFARWMLEFVAEPGALLAKLAEALAPGGLLLAIDYNHEGVSVFPESEGFRRTVEAMRRMFVERGGDPWLAGRMPRLLRAAGLELAWQSPHVLCGNGDSPVATWMDAFFVQHSAPMVEAGALTAEDRERFLAEWAARRADPDAVFFSPIVVGTAARRPE